MSRLSTARAKLAWAVALLAGATLAGCGGDDEASNATARSGVPSCLAEAGYAIALPTGGGIEVYRPGRPGSAIAYDLERAARTRREVMSPASIRDLARVAGNENVERVGPWLAIFRNSPGADLRRTMKRCGRERA